MTFRFLHVKIRAPRRPAQTLWRAAPAARLNAAAGDRRLLHKRLGASSGSAASGGGGGGGEGLPAKVGGLHNLQVLAADGCGLTSVPPELARSRSSCGFNPRSKESLLLAFTVRKKAKPALDVLPSAPCRSGCCPTRMAPPK